MNIFFKYNVIVVGGGHAGCEAAAAAANLGSKVLLISQDISGFARLSCNPSIGGIAKGQIVREIDAIGGYTGIVADKTAVQFRMLNRSKGPAMWSPRTQNDRALFSAEWRTILENIPNLNIWKDEVSDLILENNVVKGVKTKLDLNIFSDSVVITAGTFLNGKIYIGKISLSGGRIGEKPAIGLSDRLKEYGIETGKLKTGTPMRIDKRSINFSTLSIQNGDTNPDKFSFSDETTSLTKQLPCYLAYTNEKVHDILRTGFKDSPMFTGIINGVGPRYCPSIEDKIERFAGKNMHQLFVEPDGWNTNEYYLNGFSSSLPLDIQYSALKAIPGFENANIIQPGYAIEYDYFPPTQLRSSLMSKQIENLFFAGQVNGTTGYEEAAAQGLIAGINAHLAVSNLPAFVLGRADAYIGVLIDDLINKGVDEPYRMFTSRAEFRLLLRQDNADLRLTEMSANIGLAGQDRMVKLQQKKSFIDVAENYFDKQSIDPENINEFLLSKNSAAINQKIKLKNLLLRPEIFLSDLFVEKYLSNDIFCDTTKQFFDTLEIEVKYKNYIEREKEFTTKFQKFENINLPQDIDYFMFKNISYEAREKLQKIKPDNLSQAARISGVSPADIAVLLGWIKTKRL